MNILFDDQIFNAQKYGGVSRYFTELHIELNKINGISAENATIYSENQYLITSGYNCKKTFLSKKNNLLCKRIGSKISHGINRINSINRQKMNNFDIFHPTYYSPYFLKNIKKPFVVTVHDMTHEKFQDYFRENDITKKSKKVLCDEADKIIAISHSTKNDLINLLHINPDKISVVYLNGGFNAHLKSNTNRLDGLPEKYVLFVGGRNYYKNFNRFFSAMIPLLQNDSELNIVCTGASFTQIELETFNSYGLSNRVFHIYVHDESFYALYFNAMAFVFPSEYEGFGIPILEAMSAQCPAILSNTSSLPEVGGDAGMYFDPYNTQEMTSTIYNVLSNKILRAEMIKKGLGQCENFSWEQTAKNTLEVYSDALL